MANAPTKTDTKKKEKEDPRKAWQRIAPRRVDRVIQSVYALAKLARPNAYTWTPVELDKIIDALGKAFEHCERSFRNPGAVKREGFKF